MPNDTSLSPHVEHLPWRFNERFKAERAALLASIEGISSMIEREHYTSLLLNRLMFIYFMQQKAFLNTNIHYLSHSLRLMQRIHGSNTFYRDFLMRLFHEGLSMPEHSSELHALLGNVPFLDWDLFTPHEIERQYPDIQVPDAALGRLFTFFDAYSWNIDENSLKDRNTVTPAILGYIFEKYIVRQQMGAFYTKEDVTEYIVRNTVLPCLFDRMQQLCPAVFGGGGTAWQRLQAYPDTYIRPAVRQKGLLSGESMREYRNRHAHYTAL